MKRGIIIGIVVLVVLLIVLGIYFSSNSNEGILRTLKMANPLDFLFANNIIGEGYGECIVDSDCGLLKPERIICEGNNLVQEIQEMRCEGEECVERVSQVLLREGGDCSICNDNSGEAKLIQIKDGSPCNNEFGNNGLCFGGECKTDNCNNRKYIELLKGKGSCFTCKMVEGEPIFYPKEDGAICNDESGERGICSGGDCKSTKDFNLKPCGDGYCLKRETCFDLDKNKPICCNPETESLSIKIDILGLIKLKGKTGIKNPLELEKLRKETQEKIAEIVDNPNLNYLEKAKETNRILKESGVYEWMNALSNPELVSYYCEPKKSSCEKQGGKICSGTRGSVCCSKNSQCLTFTPITFSIMKKYLDLKEDFFEEQPYVPETTMGFCGYSKCPSGMEECKVESGRIKGGVICYDKEKEECINIAPYGSPTSIVFPFMTPVVQPKVCEKGFSECSHKFFFSGKTRRICCRDDLETCFKKPSSNLRCIPNPDNVGRESITQSTSVYMVRKPNDFTLNGKAYVISPHIEFKKEVSVVVSDDINKDREVYKYQNHEAVLDSCSSEELNSITKGIGSNGGDISLSGIKLDIPPKALTEDVEFTITSYKLSDCYEVGKKKVSISFIEIPKEYLKEDSNLVLIYVMVGIILLIIGIIYFLNKK